MSDDLKIKGKIISIGDREQKTDKFTVRQFIIQTGGQYPQPVQLQITNDRCDVLDAFKVGQEVTVHFDIRGNEWNGKIINNLNAWKVEAKMPEYESAPPPSTTNDDGGFPDENPF